MDTEERRIPLTLSLTDAKLLVRCLAASVMDLGGFEIPVTHWEGAMTKEEMIIRVSAMAESLRAILNSVRKE